MAYYLVHYSLDPSGTYLYPKNVSDVVWKSAVYHFTEQTMIGETDTEVEPDGKQVISLTAEKAQKLIAQYQSSYPKPKDLPADLRRMSR